MKGIRVVLFVIWGVLSTLSDGWILKTLWNWFVVPTYGLAIFTIAPAIGTALVVRYLTGAYNSQHLEGDTFWEQWGDGACKQIGTAVFVLIVGYITKSYL